MNPRRNSLKRGIDEPVNPAGKGPVNSMGVSADLKDANINAQFNDFRRRHIKQNKDIIQTNVAQKLASKALQDEILALKSEICLVRQQNAKLQHRLRTERRNEDSTRSVSSKESEMTRKALESILAAIPALQSLHMSLSNPSSSTRSGDTTLESSNRHHSQSGDVFAPIPNAKVAFRCTMPEVHSVKLAGQFRQGMKLDAVMEGEDLVVRGKQLEEEQDAGEEWIDEEPGISMESPMASRATRRHPNHPLNVPSASLAVDSHSDSSPVTRRMSRAAYVDPASPDSPVYVRAHGPGSIPNARARPSPAKRRKDKRRGRRESGLLEPIGRADAISPVPGQHDEPVDDKQGESQVGGNGNEMRQAERDGGDAEDEESVLDLVHVETTPEPSDAVLSVSAPIEGETQLRATATATPQIVIAAAAEVLAEPEEPVGRAGRRSRSSVSYKEPSLNKKMRKPDGSTSTIARSSLAPNSTGSSSTSTAPSSPALLGYSADAPHSDAGSTSSRKARTTNHGGSMRRKSQLPKAGRKALSSAVTEDEGDSDVDIGLSDLEGGSDSDEDYREAARPRPGASRAVPPGTASSSTSGVIPASAPSSATPLSVSTSARSVSTSSVRTSPRKQAPSGVHARLAAPAARGGTKASAASSSIGSGKASVGSVSGLTAALRQAGSATSGPTGVRKVGMASGGVSGSGRSTPTSVL